MAEYIKREDAIREAVQAVDDWDGGYVTSRDDMIDAYLNAIPAADVRENAHARWLCTANWNYACSYCYREPYYSGNIEDYKFCPFCGADMRGDTNA